MTAINAQPCHSEWQKTFYPEYIDQHPHPEHGELLMIPALEDSFKNRCCPSEWLLPKQKSEQSQTSKDESNNDQTMTSNTNTIKPCRLIPLPPPLKCHDNTLADNGGNGSQTCGSISITIGPVTVGASHCKNT